MRAKQSIHRAKIKLWHAHGYCLMRRYEKHRPMNKKNQPAKTAPQPLRLGFVPLTDCAPLVMAQELGLFKKFGLRVQLSRELGWATLRDKIVHGELDAAHALAAMPLAATLGLGSVACECLTALVLNLNGNAITLSSDLWKRGVRDGKTLREEIHRTRREKTFTFGIVFPFSSHRQLLRNWLSAHGIDPERDVRFVVVPPPQMVANLKAGHLDGFCVGEPWNSLAVHARAGWITATSVELDPGHPEKVLMVRGDFAAKRNGEHLALVAALARPEFVGVPEEILKRALAGQLDCGNGVTRRIENFFVFHRNDANEPSGATTAWALQLIRTSGLCPEPAKLNFEIGRRVYRTDLHEQSVKTNFENHKQLTHENQSELVSV